LPSDITQNVWSETVNMVATNQGEQPILSNGSNLPNIEQDLRNELTMDNSFSKQTPDKLISTNREDIVIDTIENKAEFTTVVNKKKNNKNKSKSIQKQIRASPYKKLHAGMSSTVIS
ncbi:22394_t:CDS:1, partial [Gigaspora rosea]